MTKGRLGCCGRLPSTMVDEEKEVHYYVSEYWCLQCGPKQARLSLLCGRQCFVPPLNL